MKYLLIFVVVFISSQDTFSQVTIRKMLGKWELYEVYKGGTEVTDQYVPDASRWVEFKSDRTYISEGESYGRKEGRFILDENTGLLSFDLDLGLNQQSYFYVEFEGQEMIWSLKREPGIDEIKIILVPAF